MLGGCRTWPAFGRQWVDFSFQLGTRVFIYYYVSKHTLATLHVFISVLLVFILNVSTLYRVSFLLLFIIISSYRISGFGAGNIYFITKIIFYTLTWIQVYIQFYPGC